MKHIILIVAALAAIHATAATIVYRLERNTETDALAIVGEDGVRRPCAIVDPDAYAMMTGQVAKVWATLNATHSGREKLHGKQLKTIVEDTVCVTVYEDGYRHAEKMKPLTPPKPPKVREPSPSTPPKPPKNISAKHWEMRQRLAERKKGKAREVTVVHDANTNTDKEIK